MSSAAVISTSCVRDMRADMRADMCSILHRRVQHSAQTCAAFCSVVLRPARAPALKRDFPPGHAAKGEVGSPTHRTRPHLPAFRAAFGVALGSVGSIPGEAMTPLLDRRSSTTKKKHRHVMSAASLSRPPQSPAPGGKHVHTCAHARPCTPPCTCLCIYTHTQVCAHICGTYLWHISYGTYLWHISHGTYLWHISYGTYLWHISYGKDLWHMPTHMSTLSARM